MQTREPGQVGNQAAISDVLCVPQSAWFELTAVKRICTRFDLRAYGIFNLRNMKYETGGAPWHIRHCIVSGDQWFLTML